MSLSSILRRGPLRFAVLISFIILAAALARLAELSTGWILAVIAIAWVLATLIERSAHRAAVTARSAPAATTRASAPVAGTAVAPAPFAPDCAAAFPVAPAPAVGPRPGAPDDDDLWLEDDVEIDPAPAPAVPRSQSQPVISAAPAVKPAPGAAVKPAPGATAVPTSEPAPEPEPELLPPPPALPSSSSLPRGIWNLWELEVTARAAAGTDAGRDEERSLILMYLREFASAEGMLGPEFDDLVRESFGDLLPAR